MSIKLDNLNLLNEVRLINSEKHNVACKIEKAVQTVSKNRFENPTGPVPKSAFDFFQGREISVINSSSRVVGDETIHLSQQTFGRIVAKEKKSEES